MSASLRFVLPPKGFSDLLKNVIEFTSALPRRRDGVLLHAERDDRQGSVSAIAVAYSGAARDWAPIAGAEGDGAVSILVQATAPEKSDVIDDLWKLAMAIGKTSSAKDAQVFVTIEHRRKITVEYGGQLVGELPDLRGTSLELHQYVDDLLDRDTVRYAGPTAFMVETLKALTKIRTATKTTVVDVAVLPDNEGAAIMALGPTFRGVLAAVDRDLYARGGPWRDGPGTPLSLVDGTAR